LTRLAIDPATGAPSVTSTAFGCPIGFSANNANCALSNGVQVAGTVAVDANSAATASVSGGIDGYYTYTGQIIDLARNTGNTITRQAVVDRSAPRMGGIAVPSVINGGQSVSFATSAVDNLDLVSADYTLAYATTPSGAAAPLSIRSQMQSIQNSVAFDNTLITAASFSIVVPSFIRMVATTTAGGAPQNNGVLAGSIAGRAYDGADNPSAPEVQAISGAAIVQTSPTNYAAVQAGGGTLTNFAVSNAAANVSNCPPAGCAGGAAPANATTVTLTAIAQGTESAGTPAFQVANPFSAVQFYYLDTGYIGASNEWILIGTAVAPSVTDNATQTTRTFTWTLGTPFDPPAAMGGGQLLRVIAVGVNAAGDALASAVNLNVVLTNP